ncbi:uncharacterized protein TNCV_444001 [Trichonephila clavipes]|nr:uncharacterized protein TNCV_444001 [Trichonephila clavipes]
MPAMVGYLNHWATAARVKVKKGPQNFLLRLFKRRQNYQESDVSHFKEIRRLKERERERFIGLKKEIRPGTAAVAEWYRYRIVACLVTSSSPIPLKTHRVGQRCTLNLSRAETPSRWCGVVVRRGGASSGGQYDEKPPVLSSQARLVLIYRPTEGMKGRANLVQPGD